MSAYIRLTTITNQGRKAIQEDPEVVREINKEAEYMGVKIPDQQALLSQYDFINILEAPSSEAIVKLAIRICAKGTTQPLTLATITLDAVIDTQKEERNSKVIHFASLDIS